MKNLNLILFFSVLILVVVGCKKKPDEKPNNPATEKEYIPTFEDSRGTMMALLTNHFVNVGDTLIGSSYGTARAKFFAEGSTTTMVDAGTVKVRPLTQTYTTLTKKENHLYTFEGGSGSGIQFHQQPTAEWEVSGNTTNNIPSLNFTLSGFTSDPIFKGPVTTINSSSDFTVELRQPIANVDKTIFAIYGKNKAVIKEAEPTATSYTFTAAEIASAGKGEAVLQIGAYRVQPFTKEGKTFHLVNEKLATQDIIIE